MRKSTLTPKPRLAIALLVSAIFATLLQIDDGILQQARIIIIVLTGASACLLVYEAFRFMLLKNKSDQKSELAPEGYRISSRYELLITLLVTALFLSFLAIDHGMIGRLRTFNMIMACLSAGLVVSAAWKIARKIE